MQVAIDGEGGRGQSKLTRSKRVGYGAERVGVVDLRVAGKSTNHRLRQRAAGGAERHADAVQQFVVEDAIR